MSRSTDSEGIFAARKAAVIERLVGDDVPRDWAVAWLESWEGGVADLHDVRRDPGFWEQAYQYALREFRVGHRPPRPRASDEGDPRL